MWTPAGDRVATVTDAARGRELESGDHVERGRLAGAVRADEARHRARPHREAHAAERRDAAEAHGELVYLQRVLARHARRCGGYHRRCHAMRSVGTMPCGMKK